MTVHCIDARTGLAFEHSALVEQEMSAAAQSFGRYDSKHGKFVPGVGCLDKYRRRSDALYIEELQSKVSRKDAFGGNAGAFPRDFEHIYAEVLEEKRRPLNWTRMVRTDGRVPLGAKTHTVRRRLGQGEAQIWRGGEAVPVVSGSRVEETFGIIYIVAAVETNYFELLSDSFQGRNNFADDSRMAVRAINERINRVMFGGDVATQVYGILNYPHLAKSVGSVPITSASSATEIRAELNRIANFPRQASGGTFDINRMAMSIRSRDYVMQTQASAASDRSIGALFLDGHESLTSIEGIQELQGVGPAGQDGIFVYDDSLEATAAVVVQPPSALPAHMMSAFKSQVVFVAAIGGIVMRDVGNNHLSFNAAA